MPLKSYFNIFTQLSVSPGSTNTVTVYAQSGAGQGDGTATGFTVVLTQEGLANNFDQVDQVGVTMSNSLTGALA